MEYIYKIQNKLNGKFYIGRSIIPSKRKTQHFRMLKKNTHHCKKLQNSYNKYGKDAFEFVIIEQCENSKIREQEILDSLDYTKVYNISKVSEGCGFGEDNPNWKGGTSKSYCACGEQKALYAKTCKNCRSREGKMNPFYNKKHSEETKKILSEKRKGVYIGNQEKIVVIEDIEYKSVSEAARVLNVSPATILHRIKSPNLKFKNYKYK